MKARSYLCFLLLLFPGLATACAPAPASFAQNQPVATMGGFQEYALPQDESGLMRPAVDGQGRLWFGEMSRNLLGSFDPGTHTFWQQTPPEGDSGIMGLVAAPNGALWFAEQYANYIGEYLPTRKIYHIYHLPIVHVPDPSDASKEMSLPSAPNDLALDKHGVLWFTELNANAIASLNTSTGAIRQYPLTKKPAAQSLNPYGITVDEQGNIWFTEATSNRLGRLIPGSGEISYFAPPGVTASLMEVTGDTTGQIWATTFTEGLLIRFNPLNHQFRIYQPGTSGALYGVTSATNGDIWVTLTSENMLARFDNKTQRFSYYLIPTPGSQPIGLVEGEGQSIWFTEAASNKLGVLHI